jgi:hypothetical protein
MSICMHRVHLIKSHESLKSRQDFVSILHHSNSPQAWLLLHRNVMTVFYIASLFCKPNFCHFISRHSCTFVSTEVSHLASAPGLDPSSSADRPAPSRRHFTVWFRVRRWRRRALPWRWWNGSSDQQRSQVARVSCATPSNDTGGRRRGFIVQPVLRPPRWGPGSVSPFAGPVSTGPGRRVRLLRRRWRSPMS